MIQWLQHLSSGIHRLNEWIGRGVSWLTTILVVLVCFDVITRYLLSDTSAWIMELEWHIFALIFLLGAGYAFRHDRHVRVDLFYANFSTRDQALVNLLGAILFLLPWSLLVIYASYDYALISYKIGETSPDPGGLPARYLIKFAITAGALLLLLQGIASLIDSAMILAGYKEPEAPAEEDITKENL
ncbi:MAG: TRAP transporter small permease subunit [Phaeodactylibacter sp.]|nr:TRAP transporter small permease subunit [Phaeodactylibacter sp.]MCB9050572.1 TRAP transporter small permease subunit [Lewinellaceae bacterium]